MNSRRIALSLLVATIALAMTTVIAYVALGPIKAWIAGANSTKSISLNKLVTWDSGKDGHATIYRAGNVTLTLRADHKSTSQFPLIILTVRAKGGKSFSLTTSSGMPSGPATADVGVGHLDPTNPTPEVVLSTYSGGAHCCTGIKILELETHGWRIIPIPDDAGGQGGLPTFPTDINGDGVRDFVLSDDRFAYAFGGFSASWLPPRVFTLESGHLVERSDSRQYTALYQHDMTDAEKHCARNDGFQNGACAGYVADAARLGQLDPAWQFMLAHYDRNATDTLPHGCLSTSVTPYGACPKPDSISLSKFPSALAWFLRDNGYISTAQMRNLVGPVYKAICGSHIEEATPSLVVASPYAVRGHCYRLRLIYIAQWLDDHAALATTFFGAGPFLIDFPTPPQRNVLFGSFIVLGERAFQYTDTAGSLVTVPRVKYLGPESKSSTTGAPRKSPQAVVQSISSAVITSLAASTVDKIMGSRFGNTVIARSKNAEWHLHFLANKTFNGLEMRSKYSVAGTWKLDGHSLCLTFRPLLPGTPNPDCHPVSVHKIGETWRSNGSTMSLVQGIQ